MAQFDLQRIDEILARFDKQLKDPSLKQKLVEPEFSKPVPLKFEGATFTLDGGASIEVFNSPDDHDEDGVIGEVREADDESFDLQPQIAFDPDAAWLKYRAHATVKGSARRNLSRLGFSFDGEAGVMLGSYRIHEPTEKLKQAGLADLSDPLTILSVDDLKQLEVGEAVSMRMHGTLNGKVRFEWADVFTGSMSFLGRLLNVNETFAIKIGAGVAADVDVSVRDDFVLIVSRIDDDLLRVALRKAKNRSVAGSLSASIGVEFADPGQIAKVLDQVWQGLAGDSIARVDRILAKSRLDSLSDGDREAAERLAERIGIDDELQDLAELREKWKELKQRADDAIRRMAEVKARVGFTYEYSRLREATSLLQATVAVGKIGQYHDDLVKGRLRPLLDDLLAERSGVELERYLHEDTLKVRRAWGFSLGIDKWSVSARGLRERDEVVRESGDRRQISFRGLRGYEDKRRGRFRRVAGDLNAAMDGFSAAPEATADEFGFGLHLMMEWRENTLRPKEVAPYIDAGVLWRAVARGDLAEQVDQLKRDAGGKKKVEIACQLTLDDAAFRWVLDRLGQDGIEERFGMALGAAMPWSEVQPDVRQSVDLRRELYGPLWADYLRDSHASPDQLADAARGRLIDRHYRRLGNLERFGHVASAGGVARTHDQLREDWRLFRQGASDLGHAIDRKQSYKKIRKAYKAMNSLWGKELYVRALGVLLVDLAREGDADVRAGVERSLSVRYPSGASEKVVTFSLS